MGPSDRRGLAQTYATRPPWNAVLRALREARGITQAGWATQLGVSSKTVLRWEAGERVPDTGAETGLIAYCREHGLLRTYEHGPLAGLTLSSQVLQEMLAEARWQSGAGRPAASRPGESDRAPEVARLVVDTPRQPPLVEREHELGLVMARLAAAGTGSAGVVVVSGEPGVGKTRLLNEVADRASKNGWQVLVGSAFDSDGMPPYLPFLEPLDHYIRVGPVDALLPRLGEVAGDLALVLPLLARKLPDLQARTLLDPESARYRLFDSLSTFIGAIADASQAGVLLCLDDLHWADDSTLQLLEHVCRRLPGTRLLILASYRDSDVNPSHPLARTLEHLIRLRVSERIDLGRLGHDGVRLMLAGLGQPDPPPALVGAVYDETDGNPFFVQEVFEYLAEEGRLFDSDGRWRDDLDVGPTEVPASVRLVIGRRLDRLSGECRALLAIAAVLGRTLKYEVLRQCSELPEDALVARLEEAEAARLLVSDEHSHLTFGHELIRQSLLSGLTALRRQRLHLRAAEALEQVYADAVDAHLVEIADQYRLAGVAADPTKVIDYATRAGDRALSVHGYAESAQQWQWALARLGEQRDTGLERGRLALRLGTLLNDTRNAPQDAVRVLDESVTCFERADEPVRAASARIELARALMEPATRDLPRALSELVSAEGVLRGQPDGPALVDLYDRLSAVGLFLMLPIQESLSANARAVAMAERLGDELRVVRNGAGHASRLALVGHITPALDLLEDHWQRAHRLNDLWTASQVMLGVQAILHRQLSDPAEMLRWIERELAAGRLNRARNHFIFWRAVEALQWLELGEIGRASQILEQAGGRDFWSDSYQARLLFRLGDWQAALALEERALEVSRGHGDRWNWTFHARALATMNRTLGDFGRAEQLAAEVCVVGAESGYVVLEADARVELARICAATGRVADARQNVDRARALLPSTENWRGLGGGLVLADAVTSAAEGSSDRAAGLFEEALATAQRHATPWLEADVLVEWGRALSQSGSGDAAAKLEAADTIYARRGAGPAWRERVAVVRSTLASASPPLQ